MSPDTVEPNEISFVVPEGMTLAGLVSSILDKRVQEKARRASHTNLQTVQSRLSELSQRYDQVKPTLDQISQEAGKAERKIELAEIALFTLYFACGVNNGKPIELLVGRKTVFLDPVKDSNIGTICLDLARNLIYSNGKYGSTEGDRTLRSGQYPICATTNFS